MSKEPLVIEVYDRICQITLNKPQVHNAFDDGLIEHLTDAIINANQNDDVRVILLSANGKSFCAGADINYMAKMALYTKQENERDAKALSTLMHTLYTSAKPTISLVQGPAMGGGVGLVACTDFALCTKAASFCFSEVNIGLIPAVIAPYILKIFGEHQTKQLFLSAKVISPLDATHYGLITKVVDADSLLQEGMSLAKSLMTNAPVAQQKVKELLSALNPVTTEMRTLCTKMIADIRVSKEGQEGLQAFIQKSKPHWKEMA